MKRTRGLVLCLFYTFYTFVSSMVVLELAFLLNGDENILTKILYYSLIFDILLTALVVGLNRDLFIGWFKEFKWYYLFYPFIGYLIYIMGSILFVIVFPQPPVTSDNQESLQNIFGSLPLAYIIVKLAVIPPIIEELIFRVGVVGLVAGKSKNIYILIAAFVVSTVIFAGLHVDSEFSSLLMGSLSFVEFISISFPYVFMGFILSGLYLISKQNGFVNIGFHFIVNFIASIAMGATF